MSMGLDERWDYNDKNGDKTFCQNPECPNDNNITSQIFQGTGYCSADCQKELDLRPPAGNMVFLTAEEERIVKLSREDGMRLSAMRGKSKMRKGGER